jgi:hypothetical protein
MIKQKQFFVLKDKLNKAQISAINGLSRVLVKKCEWCNSLIYNYSISEKRAIRQSSKDKSFGNTRFCCNDCKDEYIDWKSLNTELKKKERIKRQSAKQVLKYKLKKTFQSNYKKQEKTCILT